MFYMPGVTLFNALLYGVLDILNVTSLKKKIRCTLSQKLSVVNSFLDRDSVSTSPFACDTVWLEFQQVMCMLSQFLNSYVHLLWCVWNILFLWSCSPLSDFIIFPLLVYISEPWVEWRWETSDMPFRAEYFRVFHSAHSTVLGYTFMHCLPESSCRTPSWTFEATANVLGFPLQLDYKTLLLKTPL